MLEHVLPDTWRVEGGRASVGGVPLGSLAERFGTPLYVIDEAHLRARLRAFRTAFGPDAVLAFAAKAFFCTAMAAILREEGWWVDVVSIGEARTAMAGGVPADRLILHGNNKSPEEFGLAAAGGVGRFVVDHLGEIPALAEEARRQGTRVPILLRLALDVGAETHPKVRTSGPEAHFGLPEEQAVRAIGAAAAHPDAVELRGVHTHLGSQLADLGVFSEAAGRLVALVAAHRGAFPDRPEVNVGGGLPAPYLRDDPVVDPERLAAVLRQAVPDGHLLMVEPGRSVVANAGVSLYRIGVRKQTRFPLPFLAVDGGMSDNPRPALYGARYEALLAERAEAPHDTAFRVVGRHCEAGDVVVPEVRLPGDAGPGDLLAVPATGAYTFAMSSRYNRVPRPPVILVSDGEARVAVRRETVDDLLAFES